MAQTIRNIGEVSMYTSDGKLLATGGEIKEITINRDTVELDESLERVGKVMSATVDISMSPRSRKILDIITKAASLAFNGSYAPIIQPLDIAFKSSTGENALMYLKGVLGTFERLTGTSTIKNMDAKARYNRRCDNRQKLYEKRRRLGRKL